jgi:hypothetical protein
MTTITYGTAPATAARAMSARAMSAKPTKGFWTRIYDGLIEARTRQAEREIRNHLHLVPENVLKNSGYRATLRDSKGLPFVK